VRGFVVPEGLADQALPSQCTIAPPQPTAHTSLSLAAQTPSRSLSLTWKVPVQRLPDQRSTVPPSPTTQVTPVGSVLTAFRLAPCGSGFCQHQSDPQIGSLGSTRPPHQLRKPPPPQTSKPVHVSGQAMSLPQPSSIVPHSAPSSSHVVGTQAQSLSSA
jgi:hypothetical protein